MLASRFTHDNEDELKAEVQKAQCILAVKCEDCAELRRLAASEGFDADAIDAVSRCNEQFSFYLL